MRAADAPSRSTETAPYVCPLMVLVAYPVTCARSDQVSGPGALSLSMRNPPTPATTSTTATTARIRLYIVMTIGRSGEAAGARVIREVKRSHTLRSSRAITIRWIWLVPSKICGTFASRMYRSTGKSRV
jgi:hypothetical protein